MFSAGFNQKTVKEDLFIKVNNVYPWQKQLKKILEDIRRLSTEDGAKWLTWGEGPLAPPLDRPAYGIHKSASPFYVSFPPP